MNRGEELASLLERVFTKIQNERMVGIPVLNHDLQVEAVGFSRFRSRFLGVLITPWLMNLMMFPAEGEDWSGFDVGSKQIHEFPSGPRDFLVNAFEGLGKCQTQALYSPMFGFKTQDQAVVRAMNILRELRVYADPETQLDEKRLEQFINGGEKPRGRQPGTGTNGRGKGLVAGESSPPRPIARSDFLRGRFAGKEST